MAAPTIYLVLGQNGLEYDALRKSNNLKEDEKPAVLISYAYIQSFLKWKNTIDYREYIIDSGAFTAFSTGKPIEIQQYIRFCKMIMASPDPPSGIISLDVIGNLKATLQNYEKMKLAGIDFWPVFHYNDPFDVLRDLADEYPKIALGGCAGTGITIKQKNTWYEKCFSLTWNKNVKLHALGLTGEKSLLPYGWHSCDSSTWITGPSNYGHWKMYGGASISVSGKKKDLKGELLAYIKLERKARSIWQKEMEKKGW